MLFVWSKDKDQTLPDILAQKQTGTMFEVITLNKIT
jgi:hypothetical protein